MEIIWRSFYHKWLQLLNFINIYTDQDVYIYNIKRMRVILTNDYGRSDSNSEIQSKSERSRSVASETISVHRNDAYLEGFEYPEDEDCESRQSSQGESDGPSVSEESSSRSRVSNDSHGSKSKIH